MTSPIDKSPDPISQSKSVEPLAKSITPGQAPAGFESYMQGTKQTNPTSANQPQAPAGSNALDMAKAPALSTAGVSFNSLLAQAKTAQDSLGTVEKQLNDKNLKLKRSQSHLVRQKLGDANEYVKAAGTKLGVPMPEANTSSNLTGISRFIAMVNDGQDQLQQVQRHLQEISEKGTQMTSADMMSVQVKMGLAQQEIEYTSTLLSKVIQAITQVINTQL
jgi:hypothetical protein